MKKEESKVKSGTYICAVCEREKAFSSTEDEMMENLKFHFGSDAKPEDCVIVCDDCSKKFPISKTN